MAIIIRLDRMMADRKISLNELAEKCNRFETLNAICSALHCQPGDLIEFVDTEADK